MREHSEGRMCRLWLLVSVFGANTDGQDLVEYGVLASLIALVAFLAISTLGSTVDALWQTFPSAI
jgi:Flp pilus assembly pilin Flp